MMTSIAITLLSIGLTINSMSICRLAEDLSDQSRRAGSELRRGGPQC